MISVEKSYRFTIGFVLRVLLVQAVFAFIIAAFLRGELYRQIDYRIRGYAADVSLAEARFEARMSGDVAARAVLAERLTELAADQEQLRQGGLKSPFSVEDAARSIVQLICVDGRAGRKYYTGSGAIIGAEGLVVTNRHVVTGDTGALIRFCGIGLTTDVSEPPKVSFIGRLVAADDERDLALLKITERVDGTAPPAQFPALSMEDAAPRAKGLSLGDPIYIGGYPSVGAETLTMTEGVVAGRIGAELIKTSAYIDSGASGGAVFDSRGNYVGVPTAAARGEIGGSLGYVVGADSVVQFMNDYAAGKNLVSQ